MAPITEAAAKNFVIRHHYSSTYPAAARRFGLYDLRHSEPALVGVSVFSIPAQARVLTNVFPELEPYTESLELGRFCLLGSPAAKGHTHRARGSVEPPPANAESWMLARCFELLHNDGVRGIVSFADPVPRTIAGQVLFPGHIGVIYQASNAILTGRGTPRSITVMPDGTSLSDRALQKVRAQEQGHDYVERRLIALGARARRPGENPASWLADALNDARAVRLRHKGNLRYAMTTRPQDRKRITIVGGPQPYPKRVDTN